MTVERPRAVKMNILRASLSTIFESHGFASLKLRMETRLAFVLGTTCTIDTIVDEREIASEIGDANG